MMETLKRHAFLVGLVAGVVVLLLVILVLAYTLYISPSSGTRNELRTTLNSANDLTKNPLYTARLVQELADQQNGALAMRTAEYEALINYIRDLGHKRTPLLADLFPLSTDTGFRHQFKPLYIKKVEEFSKTLVATVPPAIVAKADSGTKSEPPALPKEGFFLLIHPADTFPRPEWVTKPEPPSLEQCREAQEDLWLMEDIVGCIAAMDKELSGLKPSEKPRIANSPVKELIEIRIGASAASLSGSRMSGSSGRFVPASAEGKAAGRAPTLSGRWSMPDVPDKPPYTKLGMFKVLPWRMVVVVESRYSGELVRRLVGTESFLSVSATQERPIVESSFNGSHDWIAPDRATYGEQGVVRMEIVGESLVFQLEGGRITTPPAAGETKAPDTKTPAKNPPAKKG
jgi:hypothetical protein